jgi:hypothetical protein
MVVQSETPGGIAKIDRDYLANRFGRGDKFP